MARLEGIRIRNYRALKDIRLGRTVENRKDEVLPGMITIIGPNGSGKSSLMDALGFLGDCLQMGVEEACDRAHRGGFEQIRTRGQSGPIEFEIYYRQDSKSRPISYSLHINAEHNVPFVAYERLRQRRKGQTTGWPFSFLELTQGRGFAWAGQATENQEGNERIEVKLEDHRRLGITTLGNLANHPRIVAFREFLEGWYLSYFIPEQARILPMAGAQKHLNREGNNLANYVEFMERQEKRFSEVLQHIAAKIPGIQSIKPERQKDGRLLLLFNEKGYVDPFYQQDMSDGTLKLLAYLLLLEDPDPPPLIGIEEPENGLHHQLLESLAIEMKRLTQSHRGPQMLITTHSPYFVDALTPQEVWILEKGADGFSQVQRAADLSSIQELFAEGIPLGSLWYSNYLGKGNP
ncbi:MAG: AAA family ATPase [Blastocatellia bacterium]|nr:AAA family ATPase [Blastocatellia bacterium]